MTSEKNFLKKLNSKKVIRLTVIIAVLIVALWGIVKLSEKPAGEPLRKVEAQSTDSIVMHSDSTVSPVIYTKVPDLSELDVDERKERFIHLMLPSILLAQKKINTQRIEVENILAKNEEGIFSSQDSIKLNEYLDKFNADNPNDLINRMQTHPVSITLAQAAIESGWGTSRFFREANNVYGVWSFNSEEDRIRAGESRNGQNIYLRSYDSLFDSVYDYLMVLARGNAYERFREARLKSQNPYRLIWFLSNYSEKRLNYVVYLRQMIEYNELTQYDFYELVEIDKQDDSWQELLDS
ncbi:glucosaminidase domain-containing protein [Marinilabilia sp.]